MMRYLIKLAGDTIVEKIATDVRPFFVGDLRKRPCVVGFTQRMRTPFNFGTKKTAAAPVSSFGFIPVFI